MIEHDVNPRVRNIGDAVLVDLYPGISLRLSVTDALKFLADLHRATLRAQMQIDPEAIEIDVTFDDEETTELRRV